MKKCYIYCTAVAEEKINGRWRVTNANHNDLNGLISYDTYYNITCDETIALFRVFGGTEKITYDGAKRIRKIVSTSPDKTQRVIYNFDIRNNPKIR